MDVCMDMHMDMCMDLCMDMCMGMCLDACVDTCIDMCTDMCMDMRKDIRMDMHMDKCMNMYMHMFMDMHMDMQKHDSARLKTMAPVPSPQPATRLADDKCTSSTYATMWRALVGLRRRHALERCHAVPQRGELHPHLCVHVCRDLRMWP